MLTLLLAIIGLQGFFPQSGTHAVGVGALNAPIPERKRLATLYVILHCATSCLNLPIPNRSREWKCPHCKERNIDLLPDPVEKPSEPEPSTAITTPTSDSISQPTVQQQPQSPTVVQSPVLTGQTPTQGPNHIVMPSFTAPNPSTANSDTPGPPRGLPPATSPTRNMPFFELGPNTAEETRVPRNVEPTPRHEQQNQENVQLQVQAFPAFRSAAENGIPLWLDSAILILSVLLGGIIAHRVMF